jgi:hypothetical protein
MTIDYEILNSATYLQHRKHSAREAWAIRRTAS